MKREFGKKLIEDFFPKIDLTHVIDTSGAYIPGHGTPTVILFGRSRKPVGETVRAVLGIKGEPTTPEDPSQGLVWQSIFKQIDKAELQDDYTSTADVPRTTFATIRGVSAAAGRNGFKESIESYCKDTIKTLGASVGLMVITGEDSCFLVESDVPRRIGVSTVIPLVLGDKIRDWGFSPSMACVWPNDSREHY